MNRMSKLGLVLPIIGTLGCGAVTSSPESRAVVDQYFDAVKLGSVGTAQNLFSAEAFVKPPREEWLRLVDKSHTKLGPLKSYTVTIVQVSNFSGTGVYTTFHCDAQYEKYTAVELFRVFQPADGGRVLIVSHNINSTGFLE